MRQLLIGFWLAGSIATAPGQPQESASSISGVIKFEGVYKPHKLNVHIDQDNHGGPGRDGKDVFDEIVLLGPKQELANVLVRVRGPVAGKFEAPIDTVELEMRNYLFRPRVSVVRAGQRLRVRNDEFNNLNVRGKAVLNKEFNVGMMRGGSHEIAFAVPEVGIRVQHECCPWQAAWIHVLEHPFFAVTGKDGAFKIANFPPGKYEMEAWHESLGTRTATVTLGDKDSKTQDFTFAK